MRLSCTVDGCAGNRKGNGLCGKHYLAQKRSEALPLTMERLRAGSERFWRGVDERGPDECWPWTSSKGGDYGQFTVGFNHIQAHVAAFALSTGALPVGIVCHRCDFPPCCNPSHLYDGSHATNAADRERRGRSLRGDEHPSVTRPERRPRGEDNARAKLTFQQVLAIRGTYAAGGSSLGAIGRQFGVTKQNVRSIVERRTWAHVPQTNGGERC